MSYREQLLDILGGFVVFDVRLIIYEYTQYKIGKIEDPGIMLDMLNYVEDLSDFPEKKIFMGVGYVEYCEYHFYENCFIYNGVLANSIAKGYVTLYTRAMLSDCICVNLCINENKDIDELVNYIMTKIEISYCDIDRSTKTHRCLNNWSLGPWEGTLVMIEDMRLWNFEQTKNKLIDKLK